ncbi:MAG: NAD(P)-dependent alcohol dehydrogenase [candidate division Zixibacteria bacterium]|nr:NAD(P)-dependent alcohol dehydrogenase [candidate division Zixibacteria bacterium]
MNNKLQCIVTDGQGIDNLLLAEKPEPPALSDNDVLIEVKAVSLNYRDLLVAKGLYGGAYDPPIIACSDMSGTVLETGSNVTNLKPGDKVINSSFHTWLSGKMNSEKIRKFVGGLGVDGVLIKKLVYPASALVKMPEYMSFEEGSTLTIAGLTAWAAVMTHGKVQPDEWLLVHGTGGVSIFAAQIAINAGAKVIMTTSNETKGKLVKEKLGIKHIINYKNEDWPRQVREITDGAGVDVVVDIAGGETLARSIKACNYSARIGVIGILDDTYSKFKLFDVITKQISLRGIFMESTEELNTLARFCEKNQLQPWIDKVFPFDKTVEAYKYLESQKHIGKVLIGL